MRNIFTNTNPNILDTILQGICNRVTPKATEFFQAPYTIEKVRKALHDMHPTNSPLARWTACPFLPTILKYSWIEEASPLARLQRVLLQAARRTRKKTFTFPESISLKFGSIFIWRHILRSSSHKGPCPSLGQQATKVPTLSHRNQNQVSLDPLPLLNSSLFMQVLKESKESLKMSGLNLSELCTDVVYQSIKVITQNLKPKAVGSVQRGMFID
ncbi:hypothetical protein VNO77_04599 [Canavalia gladiata]|uniref:Uncharacterized protein n=1 Tax=Canavalia gladiata TaxID=3824 RepID=A0AAN9N2G5_CANGL